MGKARRGMGIQAVGLRVAKLHRGTDPPPPDSQALLKRSEIVGLT